MILTITIDDKELPLIMRAYGVGVEMSGANMDEKKLQEELISRISERLYSNILCLKQEMASALVKKSSELTVELSTSPGIMNEANKNKN